MSNVSRMPFAEWLYHMSSAGVPYQARTLAIYAAIFRVTGNEELSSLCGLTGRTYDKWKKLLVDDGWVIVTQRSGGRGRGIEVHPAVKETPVTFTDVSPRNPGKFYPRNNCETGATSAGVYAKITPVITADVSAQNTVNTGISDKNPAKITPVINAPPTRARANKESSSKISNYEERETRTPARDVPHMNGVGFVISKQHDLVIPLEIINGWRKSFPAIRNLEARLQKHSSYILRGGYMHPGWQCPEGWIAGLLDEDNAKAEADAKVSDAKVSRAENGGKKPSGPSYMRRY